PEQPAREWRPPMRKRRSHPEVRKPMTIVAGFRLEEGVLFCADAQHTWSTTLKLESTKIFSKAYQSGDRSMFAIAGHVGLCKMLVQHCEARLTLMDGADFSALAARSVVEFVFRRDYERYVQHDPDKWQLGFEIQAAIYAPADRSLTFLQNEG